MAMVAAALLVYLFIYLFIYLFDDLLINKTLRGNTLMYK